MPNKMPSILHASQCYLGEGCMWHSERKSFFWTDIEGYRIYEYNVATKQVNFYRSPYKVTLIAQCERPHMVLGVMGGLARFFPETGQFEWLLDIDKHYPDNRCNDGASDSKGRLWVGTMDKQFKEGAGSLYCINEGIQLAKKLSDISISNGIVWSLDNRRMYYIDTPTRKVQSFLFDEETGDILFEKNIIQVPIELGSPDGMTIDEEGMLWIAHWGGFGVYRWNPNTGEQVDCIKVPVPNVSNCVFGGEQLDEMIITTAQEGLSPEIIKKYPHSGDVFIVAPGVKGVKQHLCAL